MKTIDVNLNNPYKILIDFGLLNRTGELIKPIINGSKVVIVSDETVWNLYGKALSESLDGIKHQVYILPSGEETKSIKYFEALCEYFAEIGLIRTDLVISFGGGVVGDLAGFASASYMRGVPFIQIPTTLLAQVDSSVGGKTAINLKHGKNLLGAFWQPMLVITDVSLLDSLESREFQAGMAEVIKYGAIESKELFDSLLKYEDKNELMKNIVKIIYNCCDIKRKIVEDDELDLGVRMKLNFGHTFGHAIERAGDYKQYTHGEAVALGMIIASKIGEKLGITAHGCSDKLIEVISRHKLPVNADLDYKELIKYIVKDKKKTQSGINLILLNEIGKSLIHTIDADVLLGLVERGI
ncbi:MAG: 3-dehydroquinate synthase [Clostridiales bacterium]|jgi:3-dehydroquinate synthase|nr:3-dehydroquinate synthase [Clostridiales bacterium]